MGAAVEVFDGSRAIEVHRARFLPVKTTNDLLSIRSDAYALNVDGSLSLAVDRMDAPHIDLDSRYYKLIDAFDARFESTPSLVASEALRVRGDWTFAADVEVRGRVSLDDEGAPRRVEPGTVLGR
jgi:UTP--glucose-1-phosphate uridylyltransferase